ncbi:MAG: hypothetical protein M1840_007601 [Geoglossum simile]|nr:MAG: hypothetical protein M1840_007601 [Geoglossum simile]
MPADDSMLDKHFTDLGKMSKTGDSVALQLAQRLFSASRTFFEIFWLVVGDGKGAYDSTGRKIPPYGVYIGIEARIAEYMRDTEKKLLGSLGAGSWPADVCSLYQTALRKVLHGYKRWENRWNSGDSEDDLWNNPSLQDLSAVTKSITKRIEEMGITPSFVGEVNTTDIARGLLSDCLKGEKHHVPWQPRNTEIQKGHVFISEKNASGIEEWDDGFTWCEVELSEDFKIHFNDDDLYRKTWIFKVDGLVHMVISYY